MNATDILTREELFYLKLLVHNYSYKEMERFLEVQREQITRMEKDIKQKLNTSHCCDTIIKAFRMNILNTYDLVSDVVKSEVSMHAYILFDKYFAKKRILPKDTMTIKDDVLNLLKTCHKKIKEEHLKNGISEYCLDPSEKNYLNMKYRSFKREIITRNIPFSKQQICEMETGILVKLQVNCWYNAYRKALELELLKRLDYNSSVMRVKLSKFEKYMLKTDKFKKFKEKMCVDVLYRELIALYNAIEYNTLHKIA